MIDERNDINDWMQASAESHNIVVNEADWQQMKLLLQPKKKRRFIIFWWWLGVLMFAGLSILVVSLYFNSTTTKTTKLELPKSIEPIVEKTKEDTQLTSTTINKKLDNNSIIRKIEATNIENDKNTKTVSKESRLQTKKRNNQFYKQSVKNTLASTLKMAKPTIDSIELKGEHNEKIESYENQLNNFHFKFEKANLVFSDIKINFGKQKPLDTLLTVDKQEKKTVKKGNTKEKKISLALGYFNGNLPLKNNGVTLQIGYAIPIIKNLSVQATTSIATFNTTEQQTFKQIKSITPNGGGTTQLRVDFSEKLYTPNSGFVVSPSVNFLSKLKRFTVETGVTKGFVINGNNRLLLSKDTFRLYNPPLPADIKVGTATYQENNFIGKDFLSMNFGFTYSIGRRYFIGANYAVLINNNTIEGIIEEKKKRNMFLVQFGIKL